MNKIKIGIIGLGRMGLTHYSILNMHPDVEIIAIADKTKLIVSYAKKYLQNINIYDDFENLIKNEYLDAIIICTPPKLNKQIIKLALQRNLNIFAEKPLATNLQDALELQNLIASSDKLVIFEKILFNKNADKLTINFLKVISKNKRFAKLPSIISEFININSQKRGIVLADITSADILSDQQRNDLKEKLKTVLGKNLSLNFTVDKKIIGGLVVKIGSKMIDFSIAAKINKLKIAMKGA